MKLEGRMLKYVLLILLLTGCAAEFRAVNAPIPKPTIFRNWSCYFEGLGPNLTLTLPLTGFQYETPVAFDETICDNTDPLNPVCNLQPVEGVFHENGTVDTTVPSVATVVYELTATSLKLIDPSGQPGYGDLVCTEIP